MKITINIPELKVANEVLLLNSHGDKFITVNNFDSTEMSIYDKFINLTQNADVCEIDNSPIELYIHRACDHSVSENRYINYEDLGSDERVIIEDFINLIKNK